MSKAHARRAFLKAAGVTIALPTFASAARPGDANNRQSVTNANAKRMVCIGNEFGMHPDSFWPERDGKDYELTKLLQPLADQREKFTLFSHLDHGLKGGHFAIHAFLTGVKAVEAKAMPDAGISIDQLAAESVGSQTRFPSLTIGSEDGLHGGCRMSWTRSGTRVPPIAGPRELFRLLFINDGDEAKKQTLDRLAVQGSILDSVLGDAKSMSRRLNVVDQRKLDEFLSSIRDVERKLDLDRQWNRVPKPSAPIDRPTDEGLAKDLPKLYDLIALALQTDSTRIATLEIGGSFAARDIGINKGYHSLSHHGQQPDKIELLVQIEEYQMQQYARFLKRLAAIQLPESDKSLLDQTMVLHGSGMGNANSHTNNDLPIILAGGGFRHGQHRRYTADKNRRVPLCNLFVSMLQQFGLEVDRFGSGQSTLTGLEQA